MKQSLYLALALATVLGGPGVVRAQQAPLRHEVAIIDLGYIFKNHGGFKTRKEGLH